jgi:hypothetical protein
VVTEGRRYHRHQRWRLFPREPAPSYDDALHSSHASPGVGSGDSAGRTVGDSRQQWQTLMSTHAFADRRVPPWRVQWWVDGSLAVMVS